MSIKAKYFFEIGEYEKAYNIAKEAFNLDPYNRMAFNIIIQSKILKKWKQFIKDYQKYIQDIEEIANKSIITKKDKLKVKIILEILLEEYKGLKSSPFLPNSLKQKANDYYKKIKRLYDELFEGS